MGNRVRIPPVLDLVGLAGNYGKSIKGLSFVVKILDTVATPVNMVNKGVKGDVEWRQAGLMWSSIDKSALCDGCKNSALTAYINNLEDFMCAYGTAVVAVPRGVTGYRQIRGTLSYDRRVKGSIVLNKWVKDGDFFISACDIADVDLRYVPEGLRAVYASVEAGSMNDLYKMRVFNNDGIQCALNGHINFGNMPVLTAASIAETGKGNVITARVTDEMSGISNMPKIQVSETLGISAYGAPNSNTGTAATPVSLIQPVASSVACVSVPVNEPEYDVFGTSLTPDARGEYVKNGRTFYNRTVFRENEDFISNIGELPDIASQRIAMLERVINTCETVSMAYLRCGIADNILKNFSQKIAANTGYTGYVLIKSVLEQVKKNASSYEFSSEQVLKYNERAKKQATPERELFYTTQDVENTSKGFKRELTKTINDRTKLRTVVANWRMGVITEDVVANMMILYSDVIILSVIAKVLKLKLDPLSLCFSGDALSIIFTNPYYLVFIASEPLDILDLDKLAMLAGKFGSAECNEIRCIAYYHQLMCSEHNNLINCRTMVPIYELRSRLPYGFCVTKGYNSQLLYNKPYAISYNALSNCTYFLDFISKQDNFKLPDVTFKEIGGTVVYPWSNMTADTAIQTYIQSGFGIKLSFEGTDYLADYTVLCKELAIYRYCELIYKTQHAILLPELVESAISSFEQAKRIELNDMQFKLEDKQKEAVMQAGCPIFAMTGGAGTGKTTTLEAMIYVFENVLKISRKDIMLLAPTGKASVRLRTVTKRKTGTIANALITCGSKLDARVIIIDECSMVSIDTMYSLLSHIKPETFVIFTGDIAQLLPIGMGKPFANMLKFLPCITLDVSKRALAHSNITKNANKLLNLSDSSPFDQGTDFMFVPCSNFDVTNVISTVVKEEILAQGGISDNIQIVSPMKKEGVAWGTSVLNTSLRGLFNPETNNTSLRHLVYFKGTKECRLNIGDRVVHLQNHAKAVRYDVQRLNDTFELTALETTGVMNGDIGVLRYIANSCEIRYTDILEFDIPSQDIWYALVEYEDVDPATGDIINYFIKYACEVMESHPLTATEIRVFEKDLEELELAFALTVHKMQGSQSDIVIFPVFPMGYLSDFISNNLVYTAWTRAIRKVIVVGSTETITQAKKTLIINRRTSVFDHY